MLKLQTMNSSQKTTNIERKRKYSWSRPLRSLPRPQFEYEETQSKVEGKTTLAVSSDGEWFQGNIINSCGDSYTISGKRRCSSVRNLSSMSTCNDNRSTVLKEDVESKANDDNTSSNDSGVGSFICQTFDHESSEYNESPSEVDSIDSELVRIAMENIDLDDDECEACYDVTIFDFETGMNHSVEGVQGVISSDQCTLTGDNLSFQSTSSSRGARADVIISKHMGTGLIDRNLFAFQGDLSFTYNDLICYPTTVSDSQWCL